MTEYDVRNYLEKIYGVKVAAVRSFVKQEYGIAQGGGK